MESQINNSVQSEDVSQPTVIASGDRQLLEQLQASAPKKWARFTTMPMLF